MRKKRLEGLKLELGEKDSNGEPAELVISPASDESDYFRFCATCEKPLYTSLVWYIDELRGWEQHGEPTTPCECHEFLQIMEYFDWEEIKIEQQKDSIKTLKIGRGWLKKFRDSEIQSGNDGGIAP